MNALLFIEGGIFWPITICAKKQLFGFR